MPNGATNVSYNGRAGDLKLGADLALVMPFLEDGTDAFELTGSMLSSIDDDDAIRFLTTFNQEAEHTSSFRYDSRGFGTRLMWRRTLREKQRLELGPFFNYALEDKKEGDEGGSEQSHTLRLGVRLDYLLRGFRLMFAPEYKTSYGEEGWEAGSAGVGLRLSNEWDIDTIPIASLFRYVSIDRLGIELEYRPGYYIEDEKWRHRARGSLNVIRDVNDKLSVGGGAGLIYDSKVARPAPTASIWLVATPTADWELKFGFLFGEVPLSNNGL